MKYKKKVWITCPSVHGNGGWYGDNVLSSSRGMQLQRALKINPNNKYNHYDRYSYYGILGAIRISTKPNSNNAIYYWHDDDCRWIKL